MGVARPAEVLVTHGVGLVNQHPARLQRVHERRQQGTVQIVGHHHAAETLTQERPL